MFPWQESNNDSKPGRKCVHENRAARVILMGHCSSRSASTRHKNEGISQKAEEERAALRCPHGLPSPWLLLNGSAAGTSAAAASARWDPGRRPHAGAAAGLSSGRAATCPAEECPAGSAWRWERPGLARPGETLTPHQLHPGILSRRISKASKKCSKKRPMIIYWGGGGVLQYFGHKQRGREVRAMEGWSHRSQKAGWRREDVIQIGHLGEATVVKNQSVRPSCPITFGPLSSRTQPHFDVPDLRVTSQRSGMHCS